MVLRFCFALRWLWLGAMLIAVASTEFFRSQGWETSRLCVKTPFLFGGLFPSGPGIWAISGAVGCCQPAGPALPPLLCPLKLFHKLSPDNNKNTIMPLAFAWRFGKTPPKHQTETDTNRNPSNSQHFLLPLSTWYGGMGKRVEVVLFLLEIQPLVLPREVMLTVGVLLKNQG